MTITLSEEDRRQIVVYRIEKAKRAYHEAVGSIDNGFVETAANRLYYAAYYAVSALLISKGITARSHNGVIQMFGKCFIKTKILDKHFGEVFNQLFSLRMTGDYQDRRNLDLDSDVLPLVAPAKQLIDITSSMAENNILNSSEE